MPSKVGNRNSKYMYQAPCPRKVLPMDNALDTLNGAILQIYTDNAAGTAAPGGATVNRPAPPVVNRTRPLSSPCAAPSNRGLLARDKPKRS